MSLLTKVKTALRIKTEAFDENELIPLISAAKTELSLAGVKKIDDTDPLVERAVILYCKANFGYESDSEKFEKAFKGLRDAISLCNDYNEVI